MRRSTATIVALLAVLAATASCGRAQPEAPSAVAPAMTHRIRFTSESLSAHTDAPLIQRRLAAVGIPSELRANDSTQFHLDLASPADEQLAAVYLDQLTQPGAFTVVEVVKGRTPPIVGFPDADSARAAGDGEPMIPGAHLLVLGERVDAGGPEPTVRYSNVWLGDALLVAPADVASTTPGTATDGGSRAEVHLTPAARARWQSWLDTHPDATIAMRIDARVETIAAAHDVAASDTLNLRPADLTRPETREKAAGFVAMLNTGPLSAPWTWQSIAELSSDRPVP